MFERPDQIDHPLYVLTMVSNTYRWRTRWKLYEDFARMCHNAGGILYTCEVAYGDRAFAITQPDNPHHLQLRTTEDLWHKENALNLLLQRLPLDWQSVAWIDSDVKFLREDIFNETLHLLERYHVVQMWSEAYDLNSDHEIIQKHHSFVYSWTHNEPMPTGGYYYDTTGHKKVFIGHPGYAWAARKEFFNLVGPLPDWGILGSGDAHFAQSLIGNVEKSIHPDMHGTYRDMAFLYQRKALRYINKNIGYVPGALVHAWHGPKVNRRYRDRWKILVNNQFNPFTDLKRDWQGLWQLELDGAERMIRMRDEIRAYFAQRKEDTPS